MGYTFIRYDSFEVKGAISHALTGESASENENLKYMKCCLSL